MTFNTYPRGVITRMGEYEWNGSPACTLPLHAMSMGLIETAKRCTLFKCLITEVNQNKDLQTYIPVTSWFPIVSGHRCRQFSALPVSHPKEHYSQPFLNLKWLVTGSNKFNQNCVNKCQ